MTEIIIRAANQNDCKTILYFIKELAKYEKAEEQVIATEQDISASLFSEHSTVEALICEVNGKPIGFAVYFYNYSTWLGRKGIYLEDLYVTPEHRGIGAGMALMKHLAKAAVNQGCGRFEWSVIDWNTPSIEFYESIGATPKSEWIGYQLAGERLTQFASN